MAPGSPMYKVLVVATDPASARDMRSGLESSGFDVIVGHGGSLGLDIADSQSPDAIVVRDTPSELDGFEFCNVLHNLFNLPLILVGDKPRTNVYSVLEAADDYVEAPISYRELAARINTLLWRYGKAKSPQWHDGSN